MGAHILTGTLEIPGGSGPSSEAGFHKLLAKIKPECYRLARMSIFESPMRARMEYIGKDKPELKPVLDLELSENKTEVHYSISATELIITDEVLGSLK